LLKNQRNSEYEHNAEISDGQKKMEKALRDAETMSEASAVQTIETAILSDQLSSTKNTSEEREELIQNAT